MLIGIIIAVIAIILIVVVLRTMLFKNSGGHSKPEKADAYNEVSEGVKKLSEAIRIKTVSIDDQSKIDWSEFKKFQELLQRQFPLVHSRLEKETIGEYSLIYKWNSGQTQKKPIVITAHMDVVPIDTSTVSDWKYEPFSGTIAEGYIWGRGTLDTKNHLITSLQAAEQLLSEGYTPDRDIYFVFGHDEEIGGSGASGAVERFTNAGVEFEYLIDEGGYVADGVIEGVDKPLALIGIGEKGYAQITLTALSEGGHSSVPPVHTAIGYLAQAINRIERKQLKMSLIKPVKEFLMRAGPEMGFVNRFILSNLWLFYPVFLRRFSKHKFFNAMLRTSTSVVMSEKAGVRPNVLPQTASAVVSFRLHAGDTGQSLLEHIKKVTKGLPVNIELYTNPDVPRQASPFASYESEDFKRMEGIIKRLYPEAIVVPYYVLGGTDARKYTRICKNIYRFTPFRVDSTDYYKKVHGNNENISIENVNKSIEFFYELFKHC